MTKIFRAPWQRLLVAFVAVVVMLPFAGGQAAAAPEKEDTVTADVERDGDNVLVKIAQGSLAIEDDNLVVRNESGTVLEKVSLSFIGTDNRTYPIDASVKGKTATLTPSTSKARSTETDAGLLARTNVADKDGYASKMERDDAALNRMTAEIGAGMTIASLVGTIVGAIIGGILGFSACVVGVITIVFEAGCIAAGATLGGIVGTVAIGGPAAGVSINRYFETINKPFRHVPTTPTTPRTRTAPAGR